MSFNIYHAADSADDLSATEAQLAQLIEDYRVQNGLPVVQLSKSLSLVGARHDEDIINNSGGYQAGIPGQNTVHGWSDDPYNALDPNTYAAVWTAPQRLGTSYTGNGYEILTGYLAPDTATTTMTPQTAMSGWEASSAHNDVILNHGSWAAPSLTWGALGIGMQNGVASAWFGHEADPAGSPDVDLQGAYGQYTVTVAPGSIRVVDTVANRDPSFTIPNAAHLKFSDGTYTVASGAFASSGAANPPAAVGWSDATTGKSGSNTMDPAAPGGPGYLQNQFIFSGSDDMAMATSAPNVFIHTGAGNDAIQVSSGQNVLDGGLGSNFLTGGTGADTFFTDARNPGVVWNTIRNFHAGDAATLWGFTPGVSSYHWDPAIGGSAGSQGATLRANIVGGNGRAGDGIDASVTFAGLSVAQAQNLQVVTGSQAAGSYMFIYNPGV